MTTNYFWLNRFLELLKLHDNDFFKENEKNIIEYCYDEIGLSFKSMYNYIKTLNFENKEKLLQDYKKIYLNLINEEIKKILIDRGMSQTIKKSKISEIIVDYVKNTEYIYSIKNDNKREMWIYNNGVYTPNGESSIKEIIREILGEKIQNSLINDILLKIEIDTYIDEDKFFNINYKDEICVENGILNIVTKELKPFNPKKIFFNKLPVTYDPNAKINKILEFFKSVLKNESDIAIIQELFGFVLYKEYFLEKAFMFIGSGRNGKSKTLELLKRFIGIENVTNIPIQELKYEGFTLSELHNKMVNIAGDISGAYIKETATFKALTGRDLISANRKFLNPIKFVNYAKMIFSANQLPKTSDLSDAFFHRWIILEFPYKFIKQDEIDKLPQEEREKGIYKPENPQILKEIISKYELSGLLNFALDGLKRLLEKKSFSYSKSMDEVKQEWLRKSDSFFAFVKDCLVEDWDSYIEKADLRKAYISYCKLFKLKPATDKSIKITLSNILGVSDERVINPKGIQKYCWYGVKYNPKIVECDEVERKKEKLSEYEIDDNKKFYYFKKFKSGLLPSLLLLPFSTLYKKNDNLPSRVNHIAKVARVAKEPVKTVDNEENINTNMQNPILKNNKNNNFPNEIKVNNNIKYFTDYINELKTEIGLSENQIILSKNGLIQFFESKGLKEPFNIIKNLLNLGLIYEYQPNLYKLL